MSWLQWYRSKTAWVIIIAAVVAMVGASWFAIKGDKGDCSPKEKRMTKRTAIGVIIGVTIMVALVACGVLLGW